MVVQQDTQGTKGGLEKQGRKMHQVSRILKLAMMGCNAQIIPRYPLILFIIAEFGVLTIILQLCLLQ